MQGWCRQTELLTSEVLERFVGLRESQAAEIVVAGMGPVPGRARLRQVIEKYVASVSRSLG